MATGWWLSPTPLKKWWSSSVGIKWHSQLFMESHNPAMFQSPPTRLFFHMFQAVKQNPVLFFKVPSLHHRCARAHAPMAAPIPRRRCSWQTGWGHTSSVPTIKINDYQESTGWVDVGWCWLQFALANWIQHDTTGYVSWYTGTVQPPSYILVPVYGSPNDMVLRPNFLLQHSRRRAVSAPARECPPKKMWLVMCNWRHWRARLHNFRRITHKLHPVIFCSWWPHFPSISYSLDAQTEATGWHLNQIQQTTAVQQGSIC